MKNNIILILVVTVISIAVIIISVTVSLGGHSDDSSLTQTSEETSGTTSRTEPVTDPVVITSEHEPPQSESPVEPEDTAESVEPAAEDIIALARSLIGTTTADLFTTSSGRTVISPAPEELRRSHRWVLRRNTAISPRATLCSSPRGIRRNSAEYTQAAE